MKIKIYSSNDDDNMIISKTLEYVTGPGYYYVYDYLHKVLKLMRVDFNLMEYLNNLQAYTGDMFQSKGDIPLELIQPIIKNFGLYAVKDNT